MLFKGAVAFITVAVSLHLARSSAVYREECTVWEREAKRIQNEPRLSVGCSVNDECSGVDCTGNYTYTGIFSGNEEFVQPICFGLYLHPCHVPSDMTVYVEVNDGRNNVSFIRTVVNDTDYNIKDLTGRFKYFGQWTTFYPKLKVEYEPKEIDGQKFAVIQMTLVPVVKLPVLGQEREIPSADVEIVRQVEVPVPDCDPDVPEIVHHPYTCGVNVSHQLPKKKILPGTDCKLNTLRACGNKEYCARVSSSSTTGACACIDGSQYDAEQSACVVLDPVIYPVDGGNSSGKGHERKKKSSVGAVVGGVLGGLVALVVVVLVAAVLVRNRRRIYERFRANEDQEQVLDRNEDVDPIDL